MPTPKCGGDRLWPISSHNQHLAASLRLYYAESLAGDGFVTSRRFVMQIVTAVS